jgi:hypothetical protein
MIPQFRFWFKESVNKIIAQQDIIKKFVEKGLKKSTEKKALLGTRTKKNRTRKNF